MTYRARDPLVVGLGLTGIRDLLAWMKSHDLAGDPPPRRTLIFGVSQSGRAIAHMLYEGWNLDEHGRPVFDGALVHVAGGGTPDLEPHFATEQSGRTSTTPSTTVRVRGRQNPSQ